jgi:hypothetical protein
LISCPLRTREQGLELLWVDRSAKHPKLTDQNSGLFERDFRVAGDLLIRN